jgi:hypothetical protein
MLTRHGSRMNKSRVLFSAFCLIVFVSACQNRSSALPPVFANNTCEPPCWANIHPGETTETDVRYILQNISSVEKGSILSRPFLGFDGIFWSFSEGGEGYVLLKNGTVWLLSFSNSDPNQGLDITLTQAIEKYGEPENLFSAFNPDIPNWGGVTFFYPEKGVDFSYSSHIEENKYQGILRPETPISSITYYAPEDYKEVFDKFFAGKPEWTEEEVNGSVYPWKGYGSISENYPTAFGKK